MITITWPENTVNCSKCGKPICTYQPIIITVKGEFSLVEPRWTQEVGAPNFEHQECPEEEEPESEPNVPP